MVTFPPHAEGTESFFKSTETVVECHPLPVGGNTNVKYLLFSLQCIADCFGDEQIHGAIFLILKILCGIENVVCVCDNIDTHKTRNQLPILECTEESNAIGALLQETPHFWERVRGLQLVTLLKDILEDRPKFLIRITKFYAYSCTLCLSICGVTPGFRGTS